MPGYTANVIAHHGVLDKNVHFIQKPLSLNDLGEKLREALENDDAYGEGFLETRESVSWHNEMCLY